MKIIKKNYESGVVKFEVYDKKTDKLLGTFQIPKEYHGNPKGVLLGHIMNIPKPDEVKSTEEIA